MQIVHIFGPEDGPNAGEGLWAVKYEPGTENAFDDLWDQWDDVEWFRDFCQANLADLHAKFGYAISVENAVNELMDEADLLMQEVVDLAEHNKPGYNLQELFKALNDTQSNLRELQLSKAPAHKKLNSNPKLRIYAVRIDPSTYVVTGGAVKLTHKMEERMHTDKENEKLVKVSTWLKERGVYFPEDLIDLP
jgi:hypothetical protein